MGKYLTACVPM